MRLVAEEDHADIDAWIKDRKAVEVEAYPKTGMIEPGVAVGFLVGTDTHVAFLEQFVTNPKAHKEQRQEAVREIALSLMRLAKEAGFKKVIALTHHVPIMKTASSLGFVYIQNCEMLGREL